MAILETKNLTYTYGVGTPFEKTAVENVNLSVEKGAFVGVIGHTGSGKSTLIQMLNGLIRPTSGQVLLNGEDIWVKPKEIRRVRFQVGMVFQSFNLFNNMTVLDNCTAGLRYVLHQDKETAKKTALENLEKVGMAPYIHAKPRQLSGGQKQRVAIAGVVAMRPDCLILDEATAMLDPRGREQVMQTIHHLNKNMGITVVSITHYMEEAAQADRVLVMSKGHVVMEGTPKEVFSQTEKVRALHLDVPQAAELRDELVKAGIQMPEGIIDTGECAQALYELLK